MNFIKIILPKDSQVVVLEDSPMRISWFRKRLPSVVICTTLTQFKDYFDSKPICDFIFLDHDLGEGNGTGVDAAKELASRFGGNPNALLIHSWNTVGAREMQEVLIGAKHIKFGDFELEVEKE